MTNTSDIWLSPWQLSGRVSGWRVKSKTNAVSTITNTYGLSNDNELRTAAWLRDRCYIYPGDVGDTTKVCWYYFLSCPPLTTLLCRVLTKPWMVLGRTKILQYYRSSSNLSFQGHRQLVFGLPPSSSLHVLTGRMRRKSQCQCLRLLQPVYAFCYFSCKPSAWTCFYQVYASIKERETGPRIPSDFDSNLFEATYRRHIDFLEDLAKRAPTKYHAMMHRIFLQVQSVLFPVYVLPIVSHWTSAMAEQTALRKIPTNSRLCLISRGWLMNSLCFCPVIY